MTAASLFDPAVVARPSGGGVTTIDTTTSGSVMSGTGVEPGGDASVPVPAGILRPAPKRIPGPRGSEADCQRTIVEAARDLLGYRVLSIRPALNRKDRWSTPIQGDPGFPDLVLVHPVAGVHFVELKRRPNRVEPAQAVWGRALLDAGANWHLVWVPEELDAFVQQLADWTRP